MSAQPVSDRDKARALAESVGSLVDQERLDLEMEALGVEGAVPYYLEGVLKFASIWQAERPLDERTFSEADLSDARLSLACCGRHRQQIIEGGFVEETGDGGETLLRLGARGLEIALRVVRSEAT